MKRKIIALCMALLMIIVMLLPLTATADKVYIERCAGKNRYDTAVTISQSEFSASENVVLASGENFADALAGGQLAVVLNAPILLTPAKSLDDGVKAEIGRLNSKKVFILGGKKTVSEDVENQVKTICEVERISGNNRIETALKIIEKARSFGITNDTIYSDAYNFPDALAAGTLVAADNYSLALSEKNELPNLAVGRELVLGGTSSLPLPNYKGERLAGENRYETALKLATYTYPGASFTSETVVLVDGTNYPDALSAISVAKHNNAPILLTNPKALDPDTKQFIMDKVVKVIIVGGKNSVSDEVANEIDKAVTPTPDPNPNPNETDAVHFELEMKDSQLSIKKYLPTGPKSVVIPEKMKWNDKLENVQQISDNAFIKREINYVSIPIHVNSIGNSAFRDNKLNKIIIPSSVKIIKELAFADNLIESIEIPSSVEKIDKHAFGKNKIMNLVIPEGVKEIGEKAFDFNNMETLKLPNSLEKLGAASFQFNKLSQIEIPKQLKVIHYSTFTENKLTSVVIPDNIEEVEHSAFYKNSINEIVFSKNMTVINEACFRFNKLNKLNVPTHIKTIGKLAFADNEISELVLNEGLEIIEPHAFGKNKITSLKLPNSIKEIKLKAFDFNQIKHLELPDKLTVINEGTFNTNQLETVEIPDSVMEIQKDAFTINKLTKVEVKTGCKVDPNAFDPGVEVTYR